MLLEVVKDTMKKFWETYRRGERKKRGNGRRRGERKNTRDGKKKWTIGAYNRTIFWGPTFGTDLWDWPLEQPPHQYFGQW